MSRTSARAAVGAIALLTALSASPAHAHDDYDDDDHDRGGGRGTFTYSLPGENVFPEGIDTFGKHFYVTSTATGDVFRGDLRGTDSAVVFLPGGEHGRTTAVGIEATKHLLIVAGGGTGAVFVYDRDSGDFLASHTVPNAGDPADPTFLNDLALARNGDVYVTDSPRDVVYRIPAEEVAVPPAHDERMDVFATFEGLDPVGEFNANGIVATRDGRYLIVVQSDTGTLFRVSLRDGSAEQIDLDGATVLAGDGLELKGKTLYVVRNRFELITEVRLRDRYTEGRVVSETTDPTFQFPTTAALEDGRLLVVNSQFDQQGETGDPVEPFTVSSIKRP